MSDEPDDIDTVLPDLSSVRLDELAALSGDPVFEAALQRLKDEATSPTEPVSGFSSTIGGTE